MTLCVTPTKLQGLSPIDAVDFVSLERLVDYDIANLRRRTSVHITTSPAPAIPARSSAHNERSPPRAGQTSNATAPPVRITFANVQRDGDDGGGGGGGGGSQPAFNNVPYQEDRKPVLLSSPPPLDALMAEADKKTSDKQPQEEQQ